MSIQAEKQPGLLRDILDSAVIIQSYLNGVSRDEFLRNTEKQDATLRRFEIIGEAASRLSQDPKDLFPMLPFRQMRGMRTIIAHDYGEVDMLQVRNTATKDLDVLVVTLRGYFKSTPP